MLFPGDPETLYPLDPEAAETTPLSLAETYASAGIPTVPVVGKVTYTTGGFHGATLDPSAFGTQWDRATGVAIVPGLVGYGGRALVALDLDGAADILAAREWLTEHGVAPTVTTISGRADGGEHLYLAAPVEVVEGFTTGHYAIGGQVILVRGSGGYVVAPGSAYPAKAPGDRDLYSYGNGTREVAEAPAEFVEWLTEHGGGGSGERADDETAAAWEAAQAERHERLKGEATDGEGFGLDNDAHRRLGVSADIINEAADRMREVEVGQRHDDSRAIIWELVNLAREGRLVHSFDELRRWYWPVFRDLESTSGATETAKRSEYDRLWRDAIAKVAARAMAATEREAAMAAVVEGLPEYLDLDYLDLDGERGPWEAIDLAAIRAAGLDPVRPDLIRRTDGERLLYSGKLHVLFGAPEAGKSLVAVMFIAQLLGDLARSGRSARLMGEGGDLDPAPVAVYIDFEDDARTYLTRLAAMGADLDLAETATRYYAGQRSLSTVGDLDGFATARLVVVDTTNAAMALDDGDPLSNRDALQFIERLKVIRRRAPMAAWVILDHEPISADGTRRQAIGAQAKFGAVDGVQYRVKAYAQPRPGHEGLLNLYATKDRPGGVRMISADPKPGEAVQHTASIGIVPTGGEGGGFVATIHPPSTDGGNRLRSAVLAEFAKARDAAAESGSEADAWLSPNQMRGRVKGKNADVDETVGDLYAAGLIETRAKGRGNEYRLPPPPAVVGKIAEAERERRARVTTADTALAETFGEALTEVATEAAESPLGQSISDAIEGYE